jgi:flagellar hook-length control protein FliK
LKHQTEDGNTMDANLNFLTAPVSNPTSVGASSGSGGLDPNLAKPMNGQEFAGVMRDLMAKGDRQELAGTTPGEATDATAAALQTLNLGNQFSVITAASPLPDPNSLAQFARAQGLSESAVQALFGDLSASTAADAATALATDPAALNGANMGLLGFPTNPLMTLPVTTAPATTAAGDANTLTLLPSAATLGWIQAHPNSLTISDQVATPVWAQAPHLSATTPKASDLSALMQTAGATGVLQALGGMGAAAPSQALGSADNLAEFAPEMGPLDAMRMRMVPAWENMTRQLAKLNGTDQAAAWGQLSANLLNSKGQGGDATEVLLDLGADDPNLMSALDAMLDASNNGLVNLDSARNTASTGALGAAATSAALANPEMTDRAAQIQDLADKLGKAMGERLQDQMERGEWKLQLKLNPGHLGKIDVELDMNLGGLDAVFKTDNLVTRELIAQGMPKLKDTLSQSGMTVANVWVNSENQRESGGNSTPRQNTASDNTVNASVTEVAATETRIKDLRSNDAWDTLA